MLSLYVIDVNGFFGQKSYTNHQVSHGLQAMVLAEGSKFVLLPISMPLMVQYGKLFYNYLCC